MKTGHITGPRLSEPQQSRTKMRLHGNLSNALRLGEPRAGRANELFHEISMKLRLFISRTAFLALSVAIPALAENTNFLSGSDGSYGALNITSNTTLDLPTNGIFNCTTISVASGTTLRFKRNPLNTPVYLLATGDISIDGAIDVSGGSPNGRIPGAGGPGGFDGGWGGYGGTGFGGTGLGGDGQGPGGGKNANCSRGASFATQGGTGTTPYGNSLLVPLIGGSGGAGRRI